jgi:trigger factor
MEITLNKTDELNGVIVMKISEGDYTEKVDKSLKELRRNVNINGFRKGNAPMGMVKKMYGTAVFVEELNKMVSESLLTYIRENNLEIFGEPLPSEKNEKLDSDEKKDFEFSFDVGFRPAINIDFSKREAITGYEIIVENDEIEQHKKYYTKRFGEYKEAETSDETSIFTADIVACDENGVVAEGGYERRDTMIPFYRLSVQAQEMIKPLKKGEKFFMATSALCTHEKDLLHMLDTDEKEKDTLPPFMQFTITLIKVLFPAEMNQDFFDSAFGKDVVHNEEEFIARLTGDIEKSNSEMTIQKLKFDIRKSLLKDMSIDLPDAFLKRWISEQEGNKKKPAEEIEKEYPLFREDLKWHLVSQHIAKSQNMEPSQEEFAEAAKKQARMFYAQYGMANVGDEYLGDITDKILKDEKQRDKLFEMIMDDKVTDYLRENLNIEIKKVTFEDYKNLNKNDDEKAE